MDKCGNCGGEIYHIFYHAFIFPNGKEQPLPSYDFECLKCKKCGWSKKILRL